MLGIRFCFFLCRRRFSVGPHSPCCWRANELDSVQDIVSFRRPSSSMVLFWPLVCKVRLINKVVGQNHLLGRECPKEPSRGQGAQTSAEKRGKHIFLISPTQTSVSESRFSPF